MFISGKTYLLFSCTRNFQLPWFCLVFETLSHKVLLIYLAQILSLCFFFVMKDFQSQDSHDLVCIRVPVNTSTCLFQSKNMTAFMSWWGRDGSIQKIHLLFLAEDFSKKIKICCFCIRSVKRHICFFHCMQNFHRILVDILHFFLTSKTFFSFFFFCRQDWWFPCLTTACAVKSKVAALKFASF